MPELPDVLLYLSALERTLVGKKLRSLVIRSPSLLKTFSPDVGECVDHLIRSVSRCGKRIVWHFSHDQFLVFHLMVAGRFHQRKTGYLPRSKNDLATFGFDDHTLVLTEASKQKRAALWCFDNPDEITNQNRGGIDVFSSSNAQLVAKLIEKNNTLKRALTDPSRFDGIGNAYSDEILFAAGLSPLKHTHRLTAFETERLCEAMRDTLTLWIDRLQEQHKDHFPEKVTAFRPEMFVHGKFNHPCSKCAAPIQRIRYASNECNYCPGCQTDGRIYADRSLSRLLKDDWPKSLDEL